MKVVKDLELLIVSGSLFQRDAPINDRLDWQMLLHKMYERERERERERAEGGRSAQIKSFIVAC